MLYIYIYMLYIYIYIYIYIYYDYVYTDAVLEEFGNCFINFFSIMRP